MLNVVDEKLPIVSSYLSFLNQHEIKEFLYSGGRVFAATEGRSTQLIRCLLQVGHVHFAEKYLQEAERKFPELQAEFSNLHLNYFGKLQTNKITRILQLFDTVESVSRISEVDCIKKEMQKGPIKTKEFFIQWNIGNEPQKNGVSENEMADLLCYCDAKEFIVSGLMIIPPKFSDPKEYFLRARFMADKFGIEKCQMGFSNDYQIAIASGTNQIRIGRLFFDNYL